MVVARGQYFSFETVGETRYVAYFDVEACAPTNVTYGIFGKQTAVPVPEDIQLKLLRKAQALIDEAAWKESPQRTGAFGAYRED
jgi:hypothetical protein